MARPALRSRSRPDDYGRKIRYYSNRFPEFCRDWLTIKIKNGGLARFELNGAQRMILAAMEEAATKGKKKRFLLGKSRQIGATTFLSALLYWRASMRPAHNAMLIGYDDDTVRGIFEMMRTFWERSPETYRPDTRHSSTKHILFDDAAGGGLKSKIVVDVARNKQAGRSGTFHSVYGTEFSLWPYPETLDAMLSALVPDGLAVFDFTGQGITNMSYSLWQDAREGANDYTAIFIPWWSIPEYTMTDLPSEAARQIEGTLDEEEEFALRAFSLTTPQLAWRRWKIRNDCQGDADVFKREFPATEEEMFMAKGSGVFNAKILRNHLERSREGTRGTVDDEGHFKEGVGSLVVYHPPVPGQFYMWGWDISEGKEGCDATAGVCVDLSLRVCAEWWGYISPIEAARPIVAGAKMYSNAMVCIETNNIGFTTQLQVMGKYHNLYRWQYFDTMQARSYTNTYGWKTTATTKPVMITWAKHLLDEDAAGHLTLEINSRRLIEEMMSYQEQMGVYGAAPEHRDDRVMAWMIALTSIQKEKHGQLRLGVVKWDGPEDNDAFTPGARRFKNSQGEEIFMPEKEPGTDLYDEKEPLAWLGD